ncbi:hypothetical protein COO60DRAFT_1682349 [Scenedesmus sp. NREL 46B-D3]|nr:hypothetical protein COO60DRAFT_1682349 [Scenedesmus sp. NREL 46B-D3]
MANDAAAEYKELGNINYKSKAYQQAADLYTKAIELDLSSAVLYSNRSSAYLQLGDLRLALEDARKATSLKPDWEKGWFRTGAALQELGWLDEALRAYQSALDCSPANQEIVSTIRALKVQQDALTKQQQQQRQQRQQSRLMSTAYVGVRDPAAWADGLTPAQQTEWLVDCYRMRVDDDYCQGGCLTCYLHGLYDPDATNDTVAEDFLIFCKLTVKAGALPQLWDWHALLRKAQALLPHAFEKSDAQDKYGSENIFAGMILPGRSLRYTAQVVYGTDCFSRDSAADEVSARLANEAEQLRALVMGKWGSLVEGQGSSLFDDVGGVQLWQQLHRNLPTQYNTEA